MTSPLTAQPATRGDLPFIARLFAESNVRDELGIGYPRCDDAAEILAELALYDATLEDSFYVLRRGDHRCVGTLGFLFDDDMPFAYLAGPLLDEGARHRLEEAVGCAEDIARSRFPALRNSVSAGNRALMAALDRRGWKPHHENLEMAFDLDRPPPGPPADVEIEQLAGRDAPWFFAVARLLARTHGWADGEQRLAEYLEQGYRAAFVRAGRVTTGGQAEAAGAVMWLHLEGTTFSRLDYVSTHEDWRGQGVGAALVHHAIVAARSSGDQRLYLALDPGNTAAHRLYLRAGFRDNLRSVIYALEQLE
jgi:ribosomal protein S18 acetylase RimI-like enzyme